MAQPIRKQVKGIVKKERVKIDRTKASKIRYMREKAKNGQEYGTSKLEEKFAKQFLDKLGINYVYQYKAESIGRYYDFRICPELHGPIIEVQGGYWHADPRLYEGKKLDKTQQRDLKIDEIKRKYCERNGIKLIYVWEKDINETPNKVMEYLKDVLKPYLDGTIENKKKRH